MGHGLKGCLIRVCAGAILAANLALAARAAEAPPLPVRVVVVTTFEVGNDTGDTPGEFQNWVERFPLREIIPFPQGNHALRYDADRHVLGIVTGMGKAHAATSIMALGLDPRFDLSKAYWILAGIAGIDPAKGSVGSAAWARYIVDGDLGYEIDAREIPGDWSTGIIPDGRSKPFQEPAPTRKRDDGGQVYKLNAALADWAYALTADTQLPDTPNLKKVRAGYPDYPNAQKPPFVLEGDTLTADRFWVGALSTRWAQKWVAYWTRDEGVFVTSAEEETGFLQALTLLAQTRRADLMRVMDLRTARDFTTQPAGTTAAQFLAGEADGSLGAYLESLDSAYRVGSRMVTELATHWDKYADQVPSGKR
jgi:purine nucleoside permease